MADRYEDLCQAYLENFKSRRRDELSFLNSFFLIQTPALVPPDFSCALPTLLIYPGITDITISCLSDIEDEKIYPIILTLIKQQFPVDSFGLITKSSQIGLFEMTRVLEGLYRTEKFGISHSCEITQISYQIQSIPQFPNCNQSHISIRHQYTDMHDEC